MLYWMRLIIKLRNIEITLHENQNETNKEREIALYENQNETKKERTQTQMKVNSETREMLVNFWILW